MTTNTSEYIYINIKLNETRNIVENTILEYEQKYGAVYLKSVKVECVAEFLDEIKNEIKILIIRRYNIIEELNKILQSSNGIIDFIRRDKIRIRIKRGVNKKC